MIKSIELTNFQSHRDTRIEFDAGVNAIVGLSDSGKTAILRALNWVINNKPSGADFQSHWGGDVSVVLTLSDGQQIKRVRTKSSNEYWLGTQCFKAFGQDVPAEIRAVLNFAEINNQFQQDGPFLLSSNPGEVAQYLNQVVRLDGIDRAASHVRKLLDAARRGVQTEEARIAELHNTLEDYAILDDLDAAVQVIEAGVATQQSRRDTREKLQTLGDKLCAQQEQVRRFEQIAGAEQHLIAAQQSQKRLAAAKESGDRLIALRSSVCRHHETLEKCAPLLLAEQAVLEAMSTDSRIQVLIGQETSVQTARAGIVKQQTALTNASLALERAEQLFHEAMPSVCPLCEQRIPQ